MIDLAPIHQQIKLKILLIGDSCDDLYNIGTVDRLSPEAPVPVLKNTESYTVPGMAANVRLNLIKFGLDVDFITNQERIIKSRYIDKRSGQHLLRVDEDPKIQPWERQTPLPIGHYDAIVISDYNKGFLTYEDIEYLISLTNRPIFIDTKKTDLSRFSADQVYIKINETEYKNRSSIAKNLIVTLGDRGAMIKHFDDEMIYPTNMVEVMDVCGCGDTFLAALTTQYLYTNNLEKAIIFANQAAGITAQHRGNYAPDYNEIKHGY